MVTKRKLEYQLFNKFDICFTINKNLTARDYHNMQKSIDSSINTPWSDTMTLNTLHSKH